MTTWLPRKGDIVSYGPWTCRVPFDADPEDTQINLIRVPQGTWANDVHISCLKLISRAPEPVTTFCGVRVAEDDETHERAVCGAREA